MDDCLASIVDLPIPLSVSLHLRPIPQDKAIDMVQGKIDWMDMEERGQKSRAANKGIILTQTSTALRYSRADAEELLDFLRNKNERLFEYAGYVFTYAASEEEVDEQIDRIISTARGSALTVEKLYYRQEEGWGSVLPFAANKCDVTRLLTSGQIAMQMPFASLEMQPARRHLPRTVEDHQHAGHPGQAIPALAHGIRLRNAGHGQVERPEERLAAGPDALRRQGPGNLDRPYR